MSESTEDPRCPECGGPIGQRATYCMHCSADLSDEQNAADVDDDGTWDQAPAGFSDLNVDRTPRSLLSHIGNSIAATVQSVATRSTSDAGGNGEPSEQLVHPEGLVDDTLTVVIGILGGIVVGLVGTVVFGVVTGSAWALLFGFVAWLGATAYLVRRRTFQGAIAMSGYAIAVVLLSVPVIAFSPVISVDGGVPERGGLFLVFLVFVAVPAGVAGSIGWIASRFIPEEGAQ